MSVPCSRVLGQVDPNASHPERGKAINERKAKLEEPISAAKPSSCPSSFTALDASYQSIEDIYGEEIEGVVEPVREAFKFSPV